MPLLNFVCILYIILWVSTPSATENQSLTELMHFLRDYFLFFFHDGRYQGDTVFLRYGFGSAFVVSLAPNPAHAPADEPD
jgi:hypothetical protein